MWTERARIIENFDEVEAYLEEEVSFHDYRLGNIEIGEDSITIMIEEVTGKLANEGAHIWEFSFGRISNLNVSMDCVLPPYIDEVSLENHEITFSLTNGGISFQAEKISLGIPKI